MLPRRLLSATRPTSISFSPCTCPPCPQHWFRIMKIGCLWTWSIMGHLQIWEYSVMWEGFYCLLIDSITEIHKFTLRTKFQNLNHLYILSFIEKEPLVRLDFNMKKIISRIYVTLSFATLTRTDQILLCFTLSKEWDSSGKIQLYSHTLFCNWKVDWNRCSNFSSPLTRLSVSPTPTEQPRIWFITSSELVNISTKIK